jgi:1-hydroxycarotenoid 3,4-desaturase
VTVIGAGMGGLAAALGLAARGLDVTVVERAPVPGGKMREVRVGDAPIDSGPTVFTMRWIFEELFAEAGAAFSEHVQAEPAGTLARHAWGPGAPLDLHADRERSAEAIAAFASPAEGRRYLDFCREAQGIFETLDRPFIRAQRPNPVSLTGAVAREGLGGLGRIRPFGTLWRALAGHLQDPRLRQLFGRYATYCGSSPFLAPATLMLVAHVEQEGVWIIRGGMHRLAEALQRVCESQGVVFRFRAPARRITLDRRGVTGVELETGEHLPSDAVICNADAAALAAGKLGAEARHAVDAVPEPARSLSALTWSMRARTSGFPLLHHSVFFSSDYPREFDEIFRQGRLPHEPTVYICAQDRDARHTPEGPERLFLLVNAPARGDTRPLAPEEIEQCQTNTFALLERCGLQVDHRPEATVVTGPTELEQLFPGTGGALYGQASHGWRASFTRPAARSRVPGLYLAGGSTHPGPGVPMAAMSGRLAARRLLSDLRSTARSRRVAMPGGTRTP